MKLVGIGKAVLSGTRLASKGCVGDEGNSSLIKAIRKDLAGLDLH